jgi:hypothetical protein
MSIAGMIASVIAKCYAAAVECVGSVHYGDYMYR